MSQQKILCVCVCSSRNSPKLSEPAQHLADDPPHLNPVCPSCGYLPLPVDSALPQHQWQGTAGTEVNWSKTLACCTIIHQIEVRDSNCLHKSIFIRHVDFVAICPNFQVMFKVRQAKAAPPPPTRRTRIRRTSSRRSGYAFSHAQGYGDLVTSGRFLRRPAVRSSGFTHVGRTTTGFSPMGRSAGYSPTGRPQTAKVPDVEVTSLQMYRTIRDPALWRKEK